MLQCSDHCVKENTYKYCPVKCLMLDSLSHTDFPPFVSPKKSLPETFPVESKIPILLLPLCICRNSHNSYNCAQKELYIWTEKEVHVFKKYILKIIFVLSLVDRCA